MKLLRVRKKLIEVALPLDAINRAAAREKSIRHGHPSTLHLWWARRPLAAARAVIFAQMVDDPSEYADDLLTDPQLKRQAERVLKRRRLGRAGPTSEEPASERVTATWSPRSSKRQALRDIAAEIERERLFTILRELVLWKNTINEDVLECARSEIRESWRRNCAEHADHPRATELFDRNILPAFHDPFAGGGALPLEAQRLGLEAHASDLNPVAVLINKAMIEIPPKFANRPPVHPESRNDSGVVPRIWPGAGGLAEDVRYYGQWMRDEAEKRIGHLYPWVEITPEMVRERPDLKLYEGRRLKVIAWLWARTVKSPNPAFAQVEVPLASTFMLSTKKGKEAYVEPVIEDGSYRFIVRAGRPADVKSVRRGTKSGGSGTPFLCLMSGSPMPFDYLRTEAKAGRMGARPMAIVAEGLRARVYLTPAVEQERTASRASPDWAPDTALPERALGFRVQQYGMIRWGDLFTPRQLVALTTFSDLVGQATEQIRRDAMAAGLPDGNPLRNGGTGATAYAQAVGVYLGLSASRAADAWSTITSWRNTVEATRGTFARQAIPMVWDYAEANPLSSSCGNWQGACLNWVAKALEYLPEAKCGSATQANAMRTSLERSTVVSTDPPYYDNIGYADLSDFFYVWLRRSLRGTLQTYLRHWPCRRPKNWLPHLTAMGARLRQRHSS